MIAERRKMHEPAINGQDSSRHYLADTQPAAHDLTLQRASATTDVTPHGSKQHGRQPDKQDADAQPSSRAT